MPAFHKIVVVVDFYLITDCYQLSDFPYSLFSVCVIMLLLSFNCDNYSADSRVCIF